MVRREGKKPEIVAAAIRLLGVEGAAGLTAAALAHEAGVSKANLFHHFESLDDIVIVAFEKFMLEMASMTPAPGTSLRGWLLNLGGETVDLIEQRGGEAGAYMAFMARAQSDARLRGKFEAVLVMAEDAFVGVLKMLAPGRWSPVETRNLANLIIVSGDGFVLHRQLFPGRAQSQHAAWLTLVDQIAPQTKEKS